MNVSATDGRVKEAYSPGRLNFLCEVDKGAAFDFFALVVGSSESRGGHMIIVNFKAAENVKLITKNNLWKNTALNYLPLALCCSLLESLSLALHYAMALFVHLIFSLTQKGHHPYLPCPVQR